MACNPDFIQYIIDQCSGAGEIAVKKMMGDYCVYCDGVLFGLICDNNFYVKVTGPGKAVLREVILRPPYDGAHHSHDLCASKAKGEEGPNEVESMLLFCRDDSVGLLSLPSSQCFEDSVPKRGPDDNVAGVTLPSWRN